MSVRNLLVIGASAGGLKALIELAPLLPENIPAAVLIVLHTAPDYRSRLPEIMMNSGPLPAALAEADDLLMEGRIYVAPSNRHMAVVENRIQLETTARENQARPAIDVLFRTAARTYREHVVAIILSGTQGDGVIGMMMVKAYGGMTIAQDPSDASYSAMPAGAARYARVDHVVPVRDMAKTLQGFFESDGKRAVPVAADFEHRNLQRIQSDLQHTASGDVGGKASVFTCPDCGGAMWEFEHGDALSLRCHVGHAYEHTAFEAEKAIQVENALWAAVRTLIEHATLSRQLARRYERQGDVERAQESDRQAQADDDHAGLIRDQILGVNRKAER